MTYASAGTDVTVRIANLNSWTVAAHSQTATRACTRSTRAAVRIPASSTRVPPVETIGQVKNVNRDVAADRIPVGIHDRKSQSYMRVTFAGA